MNDYKCLKCGSKEGEPEEEGRQNWYWRVLDYGRVGPFCSPDCSRHFKMPGQPEATFTIKEFEKLQFVAWKAKEQYV